MASDLLNLIVLMLILERIFFHVQLMLSLHVLNVWLQLLDNQAAFIILFVNFLLKSVLHFTEFLLFLRLYILNLLCESSCLVRDILVESFCLLLILFTKSNNGNFQLLDLLLVLVLLEVLLFVVELFETINSLLFGRIYLIIIMAVVNVHLLNSWLQIGDLRRVVVLCSFNLLSSSLFNVLNFLKPCLFIQLTLFTFFMLMLHRSNLAFESCHLFH